MGKARSRRVPGLGMVTHRQMNILASLIEQDDAYGGTWCNLDKVHGRTLNTLQKRDWVQRSPRPMSSAYDYKITNRGRKAYQAYCEYEPAPRRNDGICPRCGERPRDARIGYCIPCRREWDREWSSKRTDYHRRNTGKLCYRCGQHPISTNTVCNVCHAQDMVKRRARLADEIHKGQREVPMCPRCNERPRYLGETYILPYCKPCQYEKDVAHYHRRKARKMRERFQRMMAKR